VVPGALSRPAPAAAIAEQLDDSRYVDDTSVLVVRCIGDG
jgi:hypothetical protein